MSDAIDCHQAMARLKLAYEDVRAVSPRIIYVGAYGFSQEGPYAAKPAYDDIIQAVSGVAAMQGLLFPFSMLSSTFVAPER